MPTKPGPKPDPSKADHKNHSVHCSPSKIELARQVVKLSNDQQAYISHWIEKGGKVPPKPWK